MPDAIVLKEFTAVYDDMSCPSCGSEAVYFRGRVYGQITCSHCETEGPEGREDEATAGWLRMHRRPKLLNKPPDEPGWHWHANATHPDEKHITHISASQLLAIKRHFVPGNGEYWSRRLDVPNTSNLGKENTK